MWDSLASNLILNNNTIQVNENESHCTKQLLTAIASNNVLNQRQLAFLTWQKIATFEERK